MREIKFRAWNREQKEMLCPLSPVWFEENVWTEDDYAKCADLAGFDLMQFTGLKDKNGKEIYEGDVLEITDIGTQEKQVSGPVSWLPVIAGWWLDGTALGYLGRKDDLFELKVLGNIYENPELISKEV